MGAMDCYDPNVPSPPSSPPPQLPPSPVPCPTCAKDSTGTLTCCAQGASWYGTCGGKIPGRDYTIGALVCTQPSPPPMPPQLPEEVEMNKAPTSPPYTPEQK